MTARQEQHVIELPEGSWWDWDVVAGDAGQLRLASGADLAYHHELELVFHEPLFVRCPTTFQDPAFRAPTPDEVLAVATDIGQTPAIVVTFSADAGGLEPVDCLIAAESVEIVQGVVFRYWREDLAPGQRVAPWVRPEGAP